MIKQKQKIVLGMSGGVDSSVALHFLKEQGFEVIGVSLKFGFWESEKNELRENVCCSKNAIERAKRVCQKYDCPHFIIDASKEFQKTVIDYFLKTLKKHQTPNPCVFCNRDVKIMALLRFAEEREAEYAATGHYAKIRKDGEEFQLLRPKDEKKDQTYFLAFLGQNQLSKLIFPLGEHTKQEVYSIAQREDIECSPRQSQDLCFVADKSLPSFLEEEVGLEPGKIYDTKGNLLGRHQGLHFYTLGQRKGINLPRGPFWVVGFNKKNNVLIVTSNSEDPELFAKEVLLSDVSFISGKAPEGPMRVEAKVRYRQPLAKATLIGKSGGSRTSANWSAGWRLVFDKPQRAVTPGQIAVFYKGEICLGGGIID